MKMKQNQQGFTLIELMIVVAIIGILAAVAIPSYRDYTARAQMSEALSLLSGFKTGLAEYHQSQGSFQSTLKATQFGSTVSGKYVGEVKFENIGGDSVEISAKMKKAVSGVAKEIAEQKLWMGSYDGGRTWTCNAGNSSIDNRHMPASCRR